MIDAKKAVGEAKKYFADFYPEQEKTFRLEEIKFDEEKKFWNITLSFYDEQDRKAMSMSVLSNLKGENRVYKSLFINAEDASVKSMEIRKL